jgi:dTDP-L-rhamnose 4-epimerase
MTRTILITGGAGFIGSHVADELLRSGSNVRVLDPLVEQVHGDDAERPSYLDPDVELRRGDVADPAAVRCALQGVDAVIHLAAAVGVGQSMYEIASYVRANDVGTAVLLEALTERPVERLVVASSMSIYGEGLYRSATGELVPGRPRTAQQLRDRRWELTGPDGEELEPVPTPETKPADPASVYALTKYDQERLCLLVGGAYEIPTVALRFFNVYGPRQALSNPYTGVLAIFSARLLNRMRPQVFEDGLQRRDFVQVRDVARACRLALESDAAAGHAFNVAGGHPMTIADIAGSIARVLGVELEPELTGRFRAGDIRHCFADTGLAEQVLRYRAEVGFDEGIAELAGWLRGQAARDLSEHAAEELRARGLTA